MGHSSSRRFPLYTEDTRVCCHRRFYICWAFDLPGVFTFKVRNCKSLNIQSSGTLIAVIPIKHNKACVYSDQIRPVEP